MIWTDHIPDDIQRLYEIHDFGHAAAILAREFYGEFEDLCDALRTFRFSRSDIMESGGNESNIPKKLSTLLRPKNWKEAKLAAAFTVDGAAVKEETHKIDYLKGHVAFDLEWNSKDQTFDRDLYAMRAFFEYRRIDVGVILTRSNELDPFFKKIGTRTDRTGQKKPLIAKYGASTTHLGKLLPRLEAGRQGGCPILALGITPRLLENSK